MNQLLARISSYNIFNYLFPGILFAVVADAITSYSNLVLGLFIYYFFGMVVSRFGSFVVEPVLRKLHIIRFADYRDFVLAAREDEKIDILSEVNNLYRTPCALVVVLVIVKLHELGETLGYIPETLKWILLAPIMLAIFIVAYKKQTDCVRKRVEAHVQHRSE